MRRRLPLAVAASLVALVVASAGPADALAGFRAPVDLAVSGHPTNLQVATGPDGRSIAVWIHGTGTYNTVYARRIDAEGIVGPVIADLTAAGHDANRVQVALDPNDNATLVWGWQDGPASELAQTRRIAADGTLGPVYDLTASVQTPTKPQVVVDQDGVATIVYCQTGSGGNTVWTTRIAADGTPGTPHQLSVSPGNAGDIRVALDSQGIATVAWVFNSSGSRFVQALRIAADGTVGTPHDLIGPISDYPQEPRVAVAGDGSATVAWARSIGGGDDPVEVVRIAADGTVGSVLDITRAGADASQPRLAADDDGDTTLTWTSTVSSGGFPFGFTFVRTAKVARLSADGTLGTVSNLASPAAGGNSADVAVDPSGVATATWVQQDSGNRAQARSMSADGVLGPTYDLSPVGAGANLPRVAVDPRGNAIVAWENNSTTAQMAVSERGFLRAVSSVSPASDTGSFNLQLDGGSLATGVGDGGDTGLWAFPAGTAVGVGETVAPTSLSDYVTTIACRDHDGAGGLVASAQNAGPLDLTLGDAERVRCEVANTRIPLPPPPTFTSRPSALSSSSSFAFAGEVGNSLSCSIDEGPYAACASPFSPTGLADGHHTLAVVQHDPAGHASSAAGATWQLDTTAPPPPTIIAGPLGDVLSTTAVFEFSGEPGASYECRLDGGAWSACVSGLRFKSLTRGPHRLEVRQTDAAGNVGGTTTQSFDVGVATEAATPTRLRGKVAATTEVIDGRISVGCEFDRGSMRSCAIQAYAVVADGRGGTQRVSIGSGRRTTQSSAAGALAPVSVRINARGRDLLAGALAGVRTVFEVDATASDSPVSLHAKAHTRLFPPQRLIVSDDGLFASGAAALTPGGQRFLRHLGTHLRGVGSLECVGFTDALGSAADNERLALARARTVCDFLARMPAIAEAEQTTSTQGERRPRASNATPAGRALNRRVELTVRY